MFPREHPFRESAQKAEPPPFGPVEPTLFPNQPTKHFHRGPKPSIAQARRLTTCHAGFGLKRRVAFHLAPEGRDRREREVLEMRLELADAAGDREPLMHGT